MYGCFFALGFICMILGVLGSFTRFTWTNIKLGWITTLVLQLLYQPIMGFRNYIVNYFRFRFCNPSQALKNLAAALMGYGELLLD
jgi:hypothetical protein